MIFIIVKQVNLDRIKPVYCPRYCRNRFALYYDMYPLACRCLYVKITRVCCSRQLVETVGLIQLTICISLSLDIRMAVRLRIYP